MWELLILSLLGGLVLNVMPCCLPVLSLKALKLLDLAQGSRSRLWAHSVTYAAGIICTLLGLALIVVLGQLGGSTLNWGFHMSNPWILGGLASILAIMGLNGLGLLRWFDRLPQLNSIASTGKLTTSFFQGTIAALLGASCTAPFLSSALVLAFTWPYLWIFVSFGCIGLGLALPYLLLPISHKLIVGLSHKLGKYSNAIKKTSSFGLILTSIWLFWLLLM